MHAPLPTQALEQRSPAGGEPEQPLSSGPALASPGQASAPGASPAGWVWADGAALVPWQSDQGVFGLEAGGATPTGAAAGQHGDLCAVCGPDAAS